MINYDGINFPNARDMADYIGRRYSSALFTEKSVEAMVEGNILAYREALREGDRNLCHELRLWAQDMDYYDNTNIVQQMTTPLVSLDKVTPKRPAERVIVTHENITPAVIGYQRATSTILMEVRDYSGELV